MKLLDKIITNESSVLDLINRNNQDQQILLSYINQNCFNIYLKDQTYQDLINEHFNVYYDGFGVFLLLKFLGRKNLKRFNATDLNDKILIPLIRQRKNIYLIGGRFSDHQLNEFIEKTKLKIAGYSDGYFNTEELPQIAQRINEINADIIIIGMGVPKQEMIAYELSKRVKAKLIICVGYYLEFTIGEKKRINPKFRNLGIEWLFRLFMEPGRLWKRYLVGIPVFFVNMIRIKFLKVKNQ